MDVNGQGRRRYLARGGTMTEGRRSQDERLALSRMPPTVVIAFKVEPAI